MSQPTPPAKDSPPPESPERRQRRQRANGIASQTAILEATAQIAGERGYEGTSIKAVSELSGLPASSIYWHFKNKDELIAAVIERSFAAWVEVLAEQPEPHAPADARTAFIESFRESARQLGRFPDFLRLGLLLTLELRPEEPKGRERFREARAEALRRIGRLYRAGFAALDDDEAQQLAVLTLAAADGLFIAVQSEGVDLVQNFETLAALIYDARGRDSV